MIAAALREPSFQAKPSARPARRLPHADHNPATMSGQATRRRRQPLSHSAHAAMFRQILRQRQFFWERPLTQAQAIDGDYDYIIVGAGSAGCLLAIRLSADPGKRVLILEAGGRDNWIWFHIPVGYLFAIGNPRSDWMFKTEAEPGLNGRSLAYPRGKVIGG